MLIKAAALGALGYFGYRYYQRNRDQFAAPREDRPQIALAGGPLSERARVEPSDEPAEDWPTLEPKGTA